MKKRKSGKAKTTRKKKLSRTRSKKRVMRKPRPKTAKAKRQPARRPVEPSSGWAASSLDLRRVGRLAADPAETRRGRQSGDDQGISRNERLDSESVEELLEEGQAFEAAAIVGVEDALDADQGEVRTHEVPQDDVPREYEDEERP
jgi:N utilization substance protein A